MDWPLLENMPRGISKSGHCDDLVSLHHAVLPNNMGVIPSVERQRLYERKVILVQLTRADRPLVECVLCRTLFRNGESHLCAQPRPERQR